MATPCGELAPDYDNPRLRTSMLLLSALGSILCLWSCSAVLRRNDGLTWALGPCLFRVGVMMAIGAAQVAFAYPSTRFLPNRRGEVDVLTGAWVGWVVGWTGGPGWALLSLPVATVLLLWAGAPLRRSDPEGPTAPWWELILLPVLGQVVGYAAAVLVNASGSWGSDVP